MKTESYSYKTADRELQQYGTTKCDVKGDRRSSEGDNGRKGQGMQAFQARVKLRTGGNNQLSSPQ